MVHCELEQAGQFHKMAAHSAVGGQIVFNVAHECDSNSQVCDWIVSGGLQLSDNRVTAPEFVASPLAAFLHAALSDLIELSDPGGYNQSSTVPPELVSSVLFVLRTALPARAPSFIS